MITGTYIADTIDRAFDGLDIMLGVSRRAREEVSTRARNLAESPAKLNAAARARDADPANDAVN